MAPLPRLSLLHWFRRRGIQNPRTVIVRNSEAPRYVEHESGLQSFVRSNTLAIRSSRYLQYFLFGTFAYTYGFSEGYTNSRQHDVNGSTQTDETSKAADRRIFIRWPIPRWKIIEVKNLSPDDQLRYEANYKIFRDVEKYRALVRKYYP